MIAASIIQKIIFMLVLLSWFETTVLAQDTLFSKPTTVYSSLKARKFKIILSTGRVIVTHSLDSLKGNTLYISERNGPQKVSLEVIKELQVAKKKRPIARGLGLGALSGLVFGALTGLIAYKEPEPNAYFTFDFGPGFAAGAGAVAGTLGGLVSGTIIGASSNRFIHYDFSKVPLDERLTFMTRILHGK